MQKIYAKFYPVKEPKNGFIGFANLTVGDAIRIESLSVFENEGKISYQFPGFPGKNGRLYSYVSPGSSEVAEEISKVIKMAVDDKENHYAYNEGISGPFVKVADSRLVDEKNADGRYTVVIGENVKVEGSEEPEFKPMMYLKGITSVEKMNQNNEKEVKVYSPTTDTYKDKDGKVHYKHSFEPLIYKYKSGEEEKSRNYGVLIRNLVVKERAAKIAERDAAKAKEAEQNIEEPEKDENDFDKKLKNASKTAKNNNVSKSTKTSTKKRDTKENNEPEH